MTVESEVGNAATGVGGLLTTRRDLARYWKR
jgi:hypothetical protein